MARPGGPPGAQGATPPIESARQGVTSIAIYVPEGREIDLSALSPRDYEMVKGLHGTVQRGYPMLLCKRMAGDRELLVWKNGSHYFARHFPGGSHRGCNTRIGRVSDEHLRGTDCWLQAWSDAGFQTATEVATDNRVRLDAVAFGGRVTALETQVHPQSAAIVKGRHTQRLRARSLTGQHAQDLAEAMRVIWFAPTGRPDWLYQVPTIQCQNRSWEKTPDPRAVPAIGVRSIDVKPCSSMWFQRCPDQRFGWCGKAHLWIEPRAGLTIADVAEMVPAGELLPVKLGNGIYLTDRVGYARCKSFGYSEPPEPPPVRPKAKDCYSPAHEQFVVGTPPERPPQRACALCSQVHDACEFGHGSLLCRKGRRCRNPHHRSDRSG